MTLPEIGSPAPAFSLAIVGGRTIGLADYRGARSVVLWFSKGLF